MPEGFTCFLLAHLLWLAQIPLICIQTAAAVLMCEKLEIKVQNMISEWCQRERLNVNRCITRFFHYRLRSQRGCFKCTVKLQCLVCHRFHKLDEPLCCPLCSSQHDFPFSPGLVLCKKEINQSFGFLGCSSKQLTVLLIHLLLLQSLV